MRLLLAFVRQYPRQCLLVWLCLVFAGLGEGLSLSTLLPLLTMAGDQSAGLADNGASHMLARTLELASLEPTLVVMVVLVVSGLVVKAGLSLVAYRQVGYTVAHIATDCRLALLRALGLSRWEYFLRQHSGSLANAVSTEATRSATAFQNLARVVALLSQSLVFVGVALLVNWRAALLALALGAVIFMLLRQLVQVSRRAGARQQALFGNLLSLLVDSLGSLKPLKSMARESELDRLLGRHTHALNRALRKEVLSREALKAIQELLIGLMLMLGMVVALTVWQIPLAEVMVLTVVLARLLTKLSKLQQEYQRAAVNESFYWSMQASIREARAEQEHAHGKRQPTLTRGIRLDGLCFAYSEQPVLDDVSIEIPAGCCTAITGFSGAGKTTLVDLVIGLLRPNAGQVLVDDIPLEQLDIRRWRAMIGYVPQDTVLLHDTVAANVLIGSDEHTEDDAALALRQAGAWDFVCALEAGIQSSVGEHGSRLSGGQRQRILIARALVHRPKLLILDEATSALDGHTEQAVSRTLRDLGRDYTILAISHKSSLTEYADRFYRIDAGRVTRYQPAPERMAATPAQA